MQKTIHALSLATISALLVTACDKKGDMNEMPEVERNEAPIAEATRTTMVAVQPPGPDAGADAAVTVVAVQLTTIATKSHPDVLSTIAGARCQREQACGNVGPTKKYTSSEACQLDIAKEWRDELNRYECPGGFDRKELDECLREIENEDCSNPLDKLERIVACKMADICLEEKK